jgi:hypothetical protein
VYLIAAALPQAPVRACIVEVSPLLRELIHAALRRPRALPANNGATPNPATRAAPHHRTRNLHRPCPRSSSSAPRATSPAASTC